MSGKHRRMLVRLGSEETTTIILRAAPTLRLSNDEYIARNIFINHYLSPAASKLAYEARQVRRQKQHQKQRRQRDGAITGEDEHLHTTQQQSVEMPNLQNWHGMQVASSTGVLKSVHMAYTDPRTIKARLQVLLHRHPFCNNSSVYLACMLNCVCFNARSVCTKLPELYNLL